MPVRSRYRKSTTEMEVTSIRLERALKDKLKSLAGRQGYQALIRKILWDYVHQKSGDFVPQFTKTDVCVTFKAIARQDQTCALTGKLIPENSDMLLAMTTQGDVLSVCSDNFDDAAQDDVSLTSGDRATLTSDFDSHLPAPADSGLFITRFAVEEWVGNQNNGYVESASNWADIEVAIKQLDGQQKTLVTLETEGDAYMAVGGGANKHIVYATFDDERFHYLVDPSKSDTEETVIVGGQEGGYPAKWCVDLNATLKAAKTFAEQGILETSLIWEED